MSESCEHCKHWTGLPAYSDLLGDCAGIHEFLPVANGVILKETRGRAFIELTEAGCEGTLVTSYAFGCRMFRYKEEE